MNPLRWPFRAHCLLGAAACAALLAYALYVQHVLFIDPCPLCVLQRIAFAAFALVCLLGAAHGPRGARGRAAYAIAGGLVALGGVGIAGRHVWLQGLPPEQVPACGPGLDYLIEAFPLREALAKVLKGSGECAEVDWQFLGASMPAWTLVCFVLLALAALYAGLRRR